MKKQNDLAMYEKILLSKRGYVSRWPEDKKAILIVSGGLDSIILSAKLLDEGYTLFPLHIERGQTNYQAERNSINYFTKFFNTTYPGLFRDVKYIKINVPPSELKNDLTAYTKEHGHPLRDTMLQMAAVQYGASLGTHNDVHTVFCAVMPEDYFPHSQIESIRATNIAICQNMDDWRWLITSPNVDSFLEPLPIDKPTEIKWASEHGIPIERTISCNVATEETEYLNCGSCSSCKRRNEAFKKADVPDLTNYFSNGKI